MGICVFVTFILKVNEDSRGDRCTGYKDDSWVGHLTYHFPWCLGGFEVGVYGPGPPCNRKDSKRVDIPLFHVVRLLESSDKRLGKKNGV